MTGKRCGLDLKAQILEESFSPGVILVDLARSYGIRPKLLYCWRSVAKNSNRRPPSCSPTLAAEFSATKVNFVELHPSPHEPIFKITNASISFTNSHLSIDGAISAACLSRLIGVMEAEC